MAVNKKSNSQSRTAPADKRPFVINKNQNPKVIAIVKKEQPKKQIVNKSQSKVVSNKDLILRKHNGKTRKDNHNNQNSHNRHHNNNDHNDAQVADSSNTPVTNEQPSTDSTATTTEAPADSTTEVPVETTTEAPADSTTEVPVETTTEAPADSTTEVPADTTTEVPAETTTEVPAETTTEAPSDSTTETKAENEEETSTEAQSDQTNGEEETASKEASMIKILKEKNPLALVKLNPKDKRTYCDLGCVNICKINYIREKDFLSCAKVACFCQTNHDVFMKMKHLNIDENSLFAKIISWIIIMVLSFTIMTVLLKAFKGEKKDISIIKHVAPNNHYELLNNNNVSDNTLITDV